MKKILIVKTGTTVKPLLDQGEDFEDWIIAGSLLPASRFETVPVYCNASIPDPGDYQGIIVTGSPAFVTDRAAWSEATGEFLREAIALRKPVLGICYGHQLLAHSLGGEAGDRPGGREIGTVAIDLTPAGRKDALLGGLPHRFWGQVSHSQSALKLPESAVVLASSKIEPYHAFRLGDNAWGVQFHPEFSARVIKAYIRDRQQQLKEEQLDPQALDDAVRPTPESAGLLGRFAELATESSGDC